MTKEKNASLPKLTGTVIPVSALKTSNSCGCGEFLDLIPFVDFCKKCGLGLIQLLPVNDTGTESSPYSALSAFALHPLYLRIQELPEAAQYKSQIEAIAQKHSGKDRFDYTTLRQDKLDLLVKIFADCAPAIISDKKLNNWIKENPWIVPYAVFMRKKREHHEASWKSWGENGNPTEQEILDQWNDKENQKIHFFFAWLQMHLDLQFTKATEYAKKNGIIIKGDIPIMMNEDSTDTWAYPQFFNTNLRAGSPVDNYNPSGQNWGFPTYNWTNLENDNFSWWKNRLKVASKYYGAYRIDHVLGFFRIWAIPENETTAVLGHTEPLAPISTKELTDLGFSPERIRWLSKPHVPTNAIEAVNNGDYLGTHGYLHQLMDRIENEEMWLFKPEIKNEGQIWAKDIPQNIKQKLAEFWRNRTLIEVGKNKYTPIWTYQNTTAWQSLSYEEKEILENLFAEKQAKMEKLWEKQAKKLLGELTSSVDMIACAEDLGANPDSVPKVLKALKILSLKVTRWFRNWSEDGQPYINAKEYPVLSVATNSVHDSSTNRGWWLEEKAGFDFIRDFGEKTGITAENFTPETARYILENCAKAKSSFCIHPIQDFLHLSPQYYDENPNNERVNIPGSVSSFNWTYRLPKNIETIKKDTQLIDAIKSITSLHTQK